jgi:hypothetical protein
MKRSGPMKRTPLKARRDKPRRKAPERVAHKRSKPKTGAPPTAKEAAHMARVAAMPCVVPGCGAKATVHHVTASRHGGRITRTHRRVAPLCPRHHQIQFGPHESVEALNHGGFFARYGVDLEAVGDALWLESEALA